MTDTYTITYSASVYVEVDRDEGTIERVVVMDEDLGAPTEITDSDDRPVSTEVADELKALVDEVEWPAWQFGW